MVHLLLEELLELSGTVALSLHLRPESLRLSSYLHAHTYIPHTHSSDAHIPTWDRHVRQCNMMAGVPTAAGQHACSDVACTHNGQPAVQHTACQYITAKGLSVASTGVQVKDSALRPCSKMAEGLLTSK